MAITFTEVGYHGPDHEAAVGACLQANTPHQRPHSPAGWLPQFALRSLCGSLLASEYPNQRPHSPAGWLPQFALRSRCGKLTCKRIPQSEAAFASRLAPTDYATKPLWEACLQVNTPIRGRIRQQAGSHRLRYEAAVGSLLASEYPNQRPHSPAGWLPQFALRSRCGKLTCKRIPQSEAAFASRLAPTDYATKPLWEACLQANTPIRGRIRQQAGSHSLPYEAAVGSLPASEYPNQRPHSPAGWLPQFALRSRCGKLACKRIPHIRGRIRQQAGSHSLRYKAAVGACLQACFPLPGPQRRRRSARSTRCACWRASSSTSRT